MSAAAPLGREGVSPHEIGIFVRPITQMDRAGTAVGVRYGQFESKLGKAVIRFQVRQSPGRNALTGRKLPPCQHPTLETL
jgi:hypothetical protein